MSAQLLARCLSIQGFMVLTVTMFLMNVEVSREESWTLTAPASAQERVDEDQLFNQMISKAGEAYKASRFREAIKQFEGALLLRSNPNIHWNLSLCYQKIGNPQKALYHVNLYLEEGDPSPAMRSKVDSKRSELLQQMQQRLDGGVQSVRPNTSPLEPSSLSDPPAPIPSTFELNAERSDESSREKRQHRALLWGITALASFAVSTGVHLYADSVWASRPEGGGSKAQEVRRNALITSWTGDVFLAFGVAASIVAGVYYWGDSAEPPQAVKQSDPASLYVRASQASAWGVPTLQLIRSADTRGEQMHDERDASEVRGALMGWRLSF